MLDLDSQLNYIMGDQDIGIVINEIDVSDLDSIGDKRYLTARLISKYDKNMQRITNYSRIAQRYGLLKEFEDIVFSIIPGHTRTIGEDNPIGIDDARKIVLGLETKFDRILSDRMERVSEYINSINPDNVDISQPIQTGNNHTILDPDKPADKNLEDFVAYINARHKTNGHKIIDKLKNLYEKNSIILGRVAEDYLTEQHIAYQAYMYALWTVALSLRDEDGQPVLKPRQSA